MKIPFVIICYVGIISISKAAPTTDQENEMTAEVQYHPRAKRGNDLGGALSERKSILKDDSRASESQSQEEELKRHKRSGEDVGRGFRETIAWSVWKAFLQGLTWEPLFTAIGLPHPLCSIIKCV